MTLSSEQPTAPPGRRLLVARPDWSAPGTHPPISRDEFIGRSRIIAQSDLSRRGFGIDRELATKKVGKYLPAIATARQRQVSVELRENYRKANGNLPQGMCIASMNMHMQHGISRLEAEARIVEDIRELYPGFSPLRAEPLES